MPKKKNPVNGFALYMKDFRRTQEQKGIFFNSMAEVSDEAGKVWQKLPNEEKAIYNARAKQIKGEDKNDLSKKFTSLGVSYQEIENERLRKAEAENIMFNYIKNTIENLDFKNGFTKKSFYLIHVNYFYKNTSNVYKPAEIAIVRFNLSRGILKRFHRFINPGDIEIGFRSEAKRMFDFHGIPIEDPKWTKGEKNYAALLKHIVKFLEDELEKNNILPPLYTMPNNANQNYCQEAVESVLYTLCEAAGEDPDIFRIYPLHNLFHEIRLKAIQESEFSGSVDSKLITLPMALRDIEKDPFQYCTGSSCEFHEDNELAHVCSLSIASRWVYTMCDHLLVYIPDNVIPNGHVPLNCESALKSVRVAEAFARGNFKAIANNVSVNTDFGDLENYVDPITKLRPAVEHTTAPPEPRKVTKITTPSAWTAGMLENISAESKHEKQTGSYSKPLPPPSKSGYAAALAPRQQPYISPSLADPSSEPEPAIESFWPLAGRGAGRGIHNTATSASAQPKTWAAGVGRGAMLRSQLSRNEKL